MNIERLHDILESHQMWLRGKGGKKADFSQENLIGATLAGEDLRYARFYESDLRGANLMEADLRGASFYGANVSYAILNRANLREADFTRANLTNCYLIEANLCCAILKGANLYQAHISLADFLGANIDYSCLPLWCGSLSAQFDDSQLKQIAYHLVKAGLHSKNASIGTKTELLKLASFANGFHRAKECGIIEKTGED